MTDSFDSRYSYGGVDPQGYPLTCLAAIARYIGIREDRLRKLKVLYLNHPIHPFPKPHGPGWSAWSVDEVIRWYVARPGLENRQPYYSSAREVQSRWEAEKSSFLNGVPRP